jgi:hypothetical protein
MVDAGHDVVEPVDVVIASDVATQAAPTVT